MALGDHLYRGPAGARAALCAGNRELAIAGLDTVGGRLARRAREALLEGRDVDALTLLDRIIDPKWPTMLACDEAYRKAMSGEASPYMESPL